MRVWTGALTTAGLGAKERPRLRGTRNGSLCPVWPARLHIWNPGEWPGSLCFCQVLLRLFLLQRWHPAPNGDRSCAVRKEQQQPTWLGLKADLNNPTPVCPPGPAFSSPHRPLPPLQATDCTSSPCRGRRLRRRASEPLLGLLSSDPKAIYPKIGSLT